MAFRAAAVLVLAAAAWACDGRAGRVRVAERATGGSVARGAVAVRTFGCIGCHDIPGVPGPRGVVGPPLRNLFERTYLAGRIPNTAPNLARWIREPQSVSPGTAMPPVGASWQDARDMAAYLYASSERD